MNRHPRERHESHELGLVHSWDAGRRRMDCWPVAEGAGCLSLPGVRCGTQTLAESPWMDGFGAGDGSSAESVKIESQNRMIRSALACWPSHSPA